MKKYVADFFAGIVVGVVGVVLSLTLLSIFYGSAGLFNGGIYFLFGSWIVLMLIGFFLHSRYFLRKIAVAGSGKLYGDFALFVLVWLVSSWLFFYLLLAWGFSHSGFGNFS